ncbi:hypothetical protein DAEQUDRAFT_425993 [Daedalea quercina L-15889]|uniref:Uncharacterized protein n=1 Tax=Daedalea quercina L-15889 TaxID=1314783 RepID=A0A165NHH9_9APHY|nr:hypothetical protein DAEQUDRAFT_425993 [Daedalea quercina L-15889]
MAGVLKFSCGSILTVTVAITSRKCWLREIHVSVTAPTTWLSLNNHRSNGLCSLPKWSLGLEGNGTRTAFFGQ